MPRVTVTVPEQTPQPYRFDLNREVVTIGRGSENDIVVACGSVSVKHAEMHRVSRGYELRDVGSTNGIRLNDVQKAVISLKNGQNIRIGDVTFDFHLNDDELGVLADEPEKLPPLPKEASGQDASSSPEEAGSQDADASGSPAKSSGMLAVLLVFLVLAAAAFVAGMAVRYQKETGHSWLDAIQGKSAPAAEKSQK
jgi:pSer/pThr/pTyr-binding forkhead associated (FHA) protein